MDIDDLFSKKGDIPEKRLEKPFTVYDAKGRLMRITGEYDLGDGACFFIAEEIPAYGETEQKI